MHVPLSREEIADFLDVSATQVEQLWKTDTLKKSLQCPLRTVQELRYSSVYDVMEYALAARVLPVSLTPKLAALWVLQLAEADDLEEFEAASWAKRTEDLLEMAVFEGFAKMTPDPAHVARVVISTQAALCAYFTASAHRFLTLPEETAI